MIHLTTRCQHRCEHCYVDFSRGGIVDMPDSELDSVIEKCAAAGLLGNVTLLGGEPFIDPQRLLRVISKIWRMGCGTWEIFVPTNGRWVTREDWEDIVRELISLAQWFPYDLRIAFSWNAWNIAQLGDLAPVVMERWRILERLRPATFSHRTLVREELLPLGRAHSNRLAEPAWHVGVNCSFDDWFDPPTGSGFCTDYLSFYPDGSCGICYVYHSPVIGRIEDDFSKLLHKRRDYLLALRLHVTGRPFGDLSPSACVACKAFYPQWASKYSTQSGKIF